MSLLNIVIPMAGAGSRFSQAGFLDPKPLIPIHGVPMIRWVIENLKPTVPHKFIFICQKFHIEKYRLEDKLRSWAPGCEIVSLDGVTDGAACSVLMSRDLINNDSPLMIANSDQYIDTSIDAYLELMSTKKLDGMIMTMRASDPKWSYVGLGNDGYASSVVEKQVISDEATVGIYNFSKGAEFVRAAELMIRKKLRVNNEYYVAPVYNQLIAEGAKIGVFNVGSETKGMYGLGIPSDLELFVNTDLSKERVGRL